MMRAILAVFGAMALAATVATADEFERVPPVTNQAVLKECGACHLAYQPRLLPADSWRRLFDRLDDHFGEDASLDDTIRAEILAYYVAGAARQVPAEGAPLRITELSWWTRAHRPGEVREADWARAKFKGNCTACHRRAEQGIYEDD